MTLRHTCISHRARVQGSLLAGAVGDALGAPIEFLSLGEIRRRYGPRGIRDLDEAYGRLGAITDDTQMTLFTTEGLLRARCRAEQNGHAAAIPAIYHAYIRWLFTQGERSLMSTPIDHLDGWLVQVEALHSCRAPGSTCMSALRTGIPGSVDRRINNSKGCGGVMRAAPAGLVDDADPFELGTDVAALTHGHPSGFLAAGALALIVDRLLHGAPLDEAVMAALDRLRDDPEGEECVAAIDRAIELCKSAAPRPETVERIGQGWVAEEALAIGVYAALVAGEDLAAGLRLAVNHGGDSDSTGAIAGNILGAALGVGAIPLAWLETVELRDEIRTLAHDLTVGFDHGDEWCRRYQPG
jgi:ADP-ribosyl-[dinitrogen reductase] hydrolase